MRLLIGNIATWIMKMVTDVMTDATVTGRERQAVSDDEVA